VREQLDRRIQDPVDRSLALGGTRRRDFHRREWRRRRIHRVSYFFHERILAGFTAALSTLFVYDFA
jgi:hypothetical protein